MTNKLTGFVFENNIAHGAFVELSAGVHELLEHRSYSPDVRTLIGEAMAAMPLLATHLGFEGRINLQFQGESRMNLLVAQIDHHLNVRGMAKAPTDLAGSFTDLLYGGILMLMLEPNDPQRPAGQAVVLIQGESLAQALEGYFERSEQLPTLVRLVADGDRLCGFILQRMPLVHAQADEEEWNHVAMLASTLTQQELATESAETLLKRLFANEPLRTFEPRPVTVTCRCNHASISRMLLSLGREEVDSIVAEQGRVAITCEFCGREYLFMPHEVIELFAAAQTDPPGTRH